MKFTFRQILESLPVKKNSKSSWWVKLWVRKTSFFFTFLFINLGFSSNGVSLLSIAVVLAACICFTTPNIIAIWAAVILVNFWLVLDCVDGNVARCYKQKKLYGEFIDAMSGYYTVGFVYGGISVAAYHFGGLLLDKGCEYIMIAGFVSSICDILSRLIYTNYCSVLRPDEEKSNEKALTDDKHSINYIRKRVSKELGISGMFMPLIIVGAIWNCFDIVTLFYLAFNGFALISTTLMYYFKANKYDSEK